MRVTMLLRRLLGVTQMYVKGVHLVPDGPLAVSVEPSWRRSRCGGCGNRAPRYDRRPVREWRHLSWGRLKDYLAMILGQATPEGASEMLDEWLEWAARSRLKPFVKLGRTVRKHAEGILAYLDTRMTNGRWRASTTGCA